MILHNNQKYVCINLAEGDKSCCKTILLKPATGEDVLPGIYTDKSFSCYRGIINPTSIHQ